MMTSSIIGSLNSISAPWGEMMLRASITGGAVIALLWVVCRLWPGMSPSGRSWLWRAAFAKVMLALCWGLSLSVPLLPFLLPTPRQVTPSASIFSRATPRPSPPSLASQIPATDERPENLFNSPPASHSSSSSTTNTMMEVVRPTLTIESFLLLLWCLGVVFLSLRALRVWRLTQRWYDWSEPITNSALTASLNELCPHFDLAHSPQLRSCPFIDTLALTGVRCPTILLAPRFLQEEGLKASLPLMLAHELAHHKRRDLVWNWLLLVGQTLFWFHPLVWLGARACRMAQEVACDELAIKATHVPVAAYGAMLLQSAIKGRASACNNLFAVGVGERYATLHQRLSAMKYFASTTNHKRAFLFCALFAVTTLLPWHLAARSASAQTTPNGQSQAQTPPIAKSGTPSRKFSVVLDPGHGGADKGDDEKERNLSLALQLRQELEKHGVQVVLTRSKDEFLPLQKRVDVANKTMPDCFISLHGQREKGRRRPFSYILNYSNANSFLLVETLHNDLTQELKSTPKGEIALVRYYVLRKSVVPSVMVTQNLDALSTPEAQRRFVLALATAIGDYAQAKSSPNADLPILRDIPGVGKFFQSPFMVQKTPKSTTPSSPMMRKPPSTFNYLSAKTSN